MSYRSTDYADFAEDIRQCVILSARPHVILSARPHVILSALPHVILSAFPYVILSALPHAILSAFPHVILSAFPYVILTGSEESQRSAQEQASRKEEILRLRSFVSQESGYEDPAPAQSLRSFHPHPNPLPRPRGRGDWHYPTSSQNDAELGAPAQTDINLCNLRNLRTGRNLRLVPRRAGP